MSEKAEVEVLFQSSYSWVFKRTDRGFPSISIQGDSLAILSSRAKGVLEAIRQGKLDEDVEYDAEFVSETLESLWKMYRTYGWVERPQPSDE